MYCGYYPRKSGGKTKKYDALPFFLFFIFYFFSLSEYQSGPSAVERSGAALAQADG